MPLLRYQPRVSPFETPDRLLCPRTRWAFPPEESQYPERSRTHKPGVLRRPGLAKKHMRCPIEGRLSDYVANLRALPNPGTQTGGRGFLTASLPTPPPTQLRLFPLPEGHSSLGSGGLR